MKRFVLFLVIAACGHSHPTTSGDDSGDDATDAGANDASGGGGDDDSGSGSGSDASTDAAIDAGPDAAIDPAVCPVGVADGCCPTNVAYGGSDPDCTSLACPMVASDPIEIDDWQTGAISGVGMAWTGTELVLAWNSTTGTWPNITPTIVLERRDASGALTFGPAAHGDHASTTAHTHATPELGFEPTSHALLFASSILYQRYAETIDLTGAPTSPARLIGVDCNPIMARFQIYPWQGTFLVAQDNDPCGSDEWHGARVDTISTTGQFLQYTRGDYGIYQIGMTYDAAGGHIVFSGGNQYLSVRTYTPSVTWSGPQMLANLNTYDTGISYGNGRFLGAYGTYYLNGAHQITTDPWAGAWTMNPSPVVASPAVALTTGANRQTVAPRMVWTGDGWLELMSSYPWESQGLPASWSSFSTQIWRFAADGTKQQALQLDPLHPTYLVNAIWAGGKVAITYVSPDAQGRERRYLRYMSCAP